MSKGRAFIVSVVAAVMAMIASMSTAGAINDSPPEVWEKTVVGGELVAPTTPNPYLANLADEDDADYESWNTFALHESSDERGERFTTVRERQRDNDTPDRAQKIKLETDDGGDNGAAGVDVFGRAGARNGTTTDVGPTDELNGSITDAKALPALEIGDEAVGTGFIGDEAGDDFDFDFFELSGISAGETIVFDIDTPVPFGDLDPVVAIWDGASPVPLDLNDDGQASSFDSLLVFDAPADGTYYLSVGGFPAFIPEDPFDSSSPSVTGIAGSQGEYSFSVKVVQKDIDYYTFKARAGDIFGATVFGGMELELLARDGSLLIGSAQDVTFIHPESSPLPGGGEASLSYVLDREGRYTVGVSTTGDYQAQFRAFRPLGNSEERPPQVIFLDFDGEALDPGIFFGQPTGTDVTLSPLASFLPRWGLTASDEDAVIDAIVASVEESLQDDIENRGDNEDFAIEVRNSRDHPDPWGRPNVSRVVVGGTIPESGIPTIGIAQSIDVGNFDAEETAIVLLDVLSASPGDPSYIPGVSLNDFPIAGGSSIVDLVGTGVGNIIAHEAGHFFANWHTDQFDAAQNIMDQGGNLPGTIGVGSDGVFGTADDVDVDFGLDVFVSNEGFTGVEDTLQSISFGLWAEAEDDD